MKGKQLPVKVTMKEVAEHAGVSTATVSRTLITPEKVSNVARQKVRQAISATGYAHNSRLRHNRRNTSRTILVLIPNISNPFFSDILRGIEVTASKQGYLVLIADYAHQHLQPSSPLYPLLTHQAEGIILLGPQFPFTLSTQEKQSLPPIVLANQFTAALALPAVHIDNLSAAYNAVNYLWQLGHRRIACITGPETSSLCHDRLQGYLLAMKRHGIMPDSRYIIRSDMSFTCGGHAFCQLMALSTPPQALFCHNDVLALGVLAQARMLNIRIPHDVSLIGFDDIAWSGYSDPPLTTVSQPRFDIGCQAMTLLFHQLQGKHVPPGSHLLKAELTIRGTTAPCYHHTRA